MYSIAKQRKGSGVDSSAVSAHTVCACSPCRSRSLSPQRLVSNQMQKYKKVLYDASRVCSKKMQLGQMSTRRTVLKSLSAAVCGGTVKNR